MTDNWFHSWQPPTGLIPDQQPFHGPLHLTNFSNVYDLGYQQKPRNPDHGRPDTFLPYLLSLGLAKPSFPDSSSTIGSERTGPFTTWYSWKVLDFAYPSEYERDLAISKEEFIQKNNLPLGVEVFGDRLFLTMPKWKPGVPASLAVLPRVPKEQSPKLVPYPSWEWHQTDSCDGITSVFRIQADQCGRLWVLDSGQIDVTMEPKQVCPPKVLIFDLRTDLLLGKYVLPDEFIKQDSLYSNIVIDEREGDCLNVHAYLADVWRFGIVVFSLEKMRGWRVTDHLFFPEPLAAAYKVHHLEFEWTDGIFGMALSPVHQYDKDRLLYFHPMSSFREFSVKTSVLCNETGWSEIKNAFSVVGQSRGKSGHVSTSQIDRRGVMFYNLVTRDSIGCWDLRKPYRRENLGVVAKSSETLVFPNDMKIDQNRRQSVWVLTNRLPFYLYEGLDEDKVNFRVMSAFVDEAVQNTICDPNVSVYRAYQEFSGDDECY
ncbi:dopaminechrome tautomerase [Leptinotarsa decemlineata]|uniref:dopaminechrome tautomerase n=1 Tax=Leptinotarsa decemlineata TaxID=7539 RepID=UPI003D304FBC